jgi:DNA-binding FrmR family transcriptional regulator/protein-L-isoaspartate O-methyltransferase
VDKDHIFFENYAGTWDRDRKENSQQLQFLMQLAHIPQGSSIMDAGCGTGVLIPYLCQAVGETGQVEELDYSKKMLHKAKEKFGHIHNVIFTEANILNCSLAPGQYDGIVALNFYPHIASQFHEFIKRVYTALRPGGMLIIMHDMPRCAVNAIHGDASTEPGLPAVDILETALIGAGFTVVMAMDTEEYYFVKVVKAQSLPYEQYPDDGFARPGTAGEYAARQLHHHDPAQQKMIQNRLARISGHLEAIKRMVQEDRDCSEVLIQLSAVDSALVSVSKVILRNHIDHCIVDAIRENDMEAVENLKRAISTFVK